mmetsp:Transcript_44647/g.123742  ORF Transcript_44647/g.123742 Transcript_44647/m.123742 type:complete len:318 (-) Transcript_44647:727-1680(-)
MELKLAICGLSLEPSCSLPPSELVRHARGVPPVSLLAPRHHRAVRLHGREGISRRKDLHDAAFKLCGFLVTWIAAVVAHAPGHDRAASFQCCECEERGTHALNVRLELGGHGTGTSAIHGVAPGNNGAGGLDRREGTLRRAYSRDALGDDAVPFRTPTYHRPVAPNRGESAGRRNDAIDTRELTFDPFGISAPRAPTPRHHSAVVFQSCKGVVVGKDPTDAAAKSLGRLPGIAADVVVPPTNYGAVELQGREGASRAGYVRHTAAQLRRHGTGVTSHVGTAPRHHRTVIPQSRERTLGREDTHGTPRAFGGGQLTTI